MQRLFRLFGLLILGVVGGVMMQGSPSVLVAGPALQTDDPVIAAAGDISNCENEEDFLTAYLLESIDGPVLTLGDNAYEVGSMVDFMNCFDPSWGRHKDRIYPSPGNHEYGTQGAEGYFTYFGDRATPLEPGCTRDCGGYYSFDVGEWHMISLNSEIDTRPGSPQEEWLRANLAANPAKCTLAYWHRPRFTSGRYYARQAGHGLWEALYDYGADVVLVGHDHDYERFAPQDKSGNLDYEHGIREFVVGTGGATLRDFYFVQPNSEARNSETWGILKMTLHPDSYDWEFIPMPGQTWTDSGSSSCVSPANPPPAPPTTASVTPVSTVSTAVSTAATAPATAPAATAVTATRYTIQSGDTLFGIALSLGLDWTTLAAANGLSEESILQVGQVLQLPGGGSGASAATAAASPAPAVATSAPAAAPTVTTTGAAYTVQSGDTLFSIAARNGLTWQQLAAANGMTESDFLQIGQKLVIPGKAPAPAITTAPAATAAPATTARTGETHTVAGGETVISIALAYGLNWRELMRLNGLAEDSILQIGQEIRLQ